MLSLEELCSPLDFLFALEVIEDDEDAAKHIWYMVSSSLLLLSSSLVLPCLSHPASLSLSLVPFRLEMKK